MKEALQTETQAEKTIKPKPCRKDFVGVKFGRLLLLEFSHSDRHGHRNWLCKCDCGTQRVFNGPRLASGKTRSCGCLEKDEPHSLRHGQAKGKRSAEYRTWQNMLNRVRNPNTKRFYNYGGRGIKVYPEWANSFEAFYADMGPKPSPQHSIDRVDNDGDYGPSNCKWSTKSEQARNRRSSQIVEFNGLCMTLVEWSEKTGISLPTLIGRRRMGWGVEKQLTTPVQKQKRKPRKNYYDN